MPSVKDDEHISKPWQVCLSPLSLHCPVPGGLLTSPLPLHNRLRQATPETPATRGDRNAWGARALKEERRYGALLRVGLGSWAGEKADCVLGVRSYLWGPAG